MGIFVGDSIYNSGGGGGGAKSGGSIPDADFMEISNNLIYSYENDSRADLNFYFGQSQDTPYSATIEIENNVNSSIHVYALNDSGVFVELGFIGSNSLSSGKEYTITIIGNSYVIEEVTEPVVDPDNILVLNEMDNKVYPCTKVNGIYWATEDFLKHCEFSKVNTIVGPWRVPTQTDFQNIIDNYTVENVTIADGWNQYISPSPTNSTKLAFRGNGYIENGTLYQEKLFGAWWRNVDVGGTNSFVIRAGVNQWVPTDVYWELYSASGFNTAKVSLRLIYDP